MQVFEQKAFTPALAQTPVRQSKAPLPLQSSPKRLRPPLHEPRWGMQYFRVGPVGSATSLQTKPVP